MDLSPETARTAAAIASAVAALFAAVATYKLFSIQKRGERIRIRPEIEIEKHKVECNNSRDGNAKTYFVWLRYYNSGSGTARNIQISPDHISKNGVCSENEKVSHLYVGAGNTFIAYKVYVNDAGSQHLITVISVEYEDIEGLRYEAKWLVHLPIIISGVMPEEVDLNVEYRIPTRRASFLHRILWRVLPKQKMRGRVRLT